LTGKPAEPAGPNVLIIASRRTLVRRAVPATTVEETTSGRDFMDLFEINDTQRMRREEAAAKLRALADTLATNNSVEFHREGRLITVRIPAEVNLKVEVELGDEGENELEVELTW
jgi:amphi-Trp domain-containing protein